MQRSRPGWTSSSALTFPPLRTIILKDSGHVDDRVTIVPLYEYLCARCDVKFDLLRSFSQADAPVVCPECRGDDAKRMISLFASFARGSDGSTRPVGGGGSCAGCAASNCAGCRR